jgi:hypothetical protein
VVPVLRPNERKLYLRPWVEVLKQDTENHLVINHRTGRCFQLDIILEGLFEALSKGILYSDVIDMLSESGVDSPIDVIFTLVEEGIFWLLGI